MAAQRSWRNDAVNLAEFDAWDRAMRKRLGFWAGLSFLQRHGTEKRATITIAARHWPHKLCWDWCIHWSPYRRGFDGQRQVRFWLKPSIGNSIGAALWFGRITLSWQHYDHMPVSGPMGADAPKIIWKRDMDTAPFNARSSALSR